MFVIHTVGNLTPQGGGPSYTVPALCYELNQQSGIAVAIAAGHPGDPADRWQASGLPIHKLPGYQPSVGLNSIVEGQNDAIMHDHGQWLPINYASARVSRSRRLQRIVSPRGMLSPWSLNHRKWKKNLAWWLYAKRDLMQARVVHATSPLEADELRALGVRQPIAVIPNGIDMMEMIDDLPAQSDRPYAVFLSRIHRKKGVQELLNVWQRMNVNEWELVFAGYDEENIFSGRSLPPGVRFIGPVEGEAKQRLLQGAGLFVLPSHTENFGVVVAEALNCGVPVVTTHGTPWQSLETERCGWWIPMNEDRLQETLTHAIGLSDLERREMGNRGREFVARSFGWKGIAANMADVYRWMLGGGPSPACLLA